MAAYVRNASVFIKRVSVVRQGFLMHLRPAIATSQRQAHGPRIIRPVIKGETEQEFDDRFEDWFNSDELDDWELRQGLNVIYGHDLVPESRVVAAMLRAARRLNDVAMSIRILEAVNEKGANNKEIYDYIIQSVRPTLDELGISTPEELGLDKVQELSQHTVNVLGHNTASPAAALR